MIYLDYNATTPIDPEVKNILLESMDMLWGNPSSLHAVGEKALIALEKSRITISDLLKTEPREIFFTSGGTESNNIALKGLCATGERREILISSIEHPSVKGVARALGLRGFNVIEIPVNSEGIVELEFIEKNISEKTALVSVMMANNETGVLQPIEEIGFLTEKFGAKFHCDAVQAFGKVPIDLSSLHITSLSASSHKIYGPKGVGLLYVKTGEDVEPLFNGGHQERSIRPGTQDVPAIIGFAKSAELAYSRLDKESSRLYELTELLFENINKRMDSIVRNGDARKRVPNTLNVSFPGTTSEIVVPLLDEMGIMVSGGSACASGSTDPSYVIFSMGRRLQDAISAIRFSLGQSTTYDDILKTVDAVEKIVKKIRNLN